MTRLYTIPGLAGRAEVEGAFEWLVAVTLTPLLLRVIPLGIEALATRRRWRAAHRLYAAWARLLTLGLRLHVELRGLDHLPAEPVVILSLHEGMADPLVLLLLGRPLRFVASVELLDWPLLGRHLRRTNQLLVERRSHLTSGTADARRLVEGARRELARGEDVVVFAQGTVLGIEAGMQRGAWKLARLLGAPVVPVAIAGSHRVWEHPFSARLRFAQRVTVEVLPALEAIDLPGRLGLERLLKDAATARSMPPVRHYVPDRDGWWDGHRFEIDPGYPDLAARVAEHRASLPPEARGRDKPSGRSLANHLRNVDPSD